MRAFFALWPDAGSRAVLHARAIASAASAKGRAVAAEKLHLTLVFLGDIDARTVDCLSGAADSAAAGPIDLELSIIGSWRKARLVWMAPGAVPAALGRLEESLAAIARNCGARLETRPYFPHLTLVRGAAATVPEAAVAPVRLGFSDFVLVRSDLGSGRYEVIGRWPLG